MTVKLRIKELRLANNHTQRFLGDYLGVTESNYRKLESNDLASIKVEFIDKLCTLFNCEPGDLFEYVRNT